MGVEGTSVEVFSGGFDPQVVSGGGEVTSVEGGRVWGSNTSDRQCEAPAEVIEPHTVDRET